MKVLFIGGTGVISTSCSRLALERGMELTLLNRGRRASDLEGARSWVADVKDIESVRRVLGEEEFDVVANFINFRVEEIERDIELFTGRTRQYLFISSASVYQKPLERYLVTESTPLRNPFWQYSRHKIACEDCLQGAYRETGFPMVIVRPSYTYNETLFPLAIGGGSHYTVAARIRQGKPVVVHGDGSSLWTNTHADDFAQGFVGLFGNRQTIGEAFHITSDEVLSWDQYYRTLGEAVGADPRIVHVPSEVIAGIHPGEEGSLLGDKTYSTVFDNTKIKRFVPGFQATIPFREGIRRTLAWFESDPERMAANPDQDTMIERILQAVSL